MKYHCLSLTLLVLNTNVKSQVYNNAFMIQSSGNDRGVCITTDVSGNVVTAGYFNGYADFDPSAGGTASLNPNGSFADIYLAKYDASLAYMWAIRLGGSSTDNPYALATDGSGNIIVAGDFQGTMNLSSTFSPSSTLNSGGSGDRNGFVVKYDASGTLVWGISIGGVNKDVAYGVKTDAAGNVYVTGYFSNTVDFDPSSSTFTLSSYGGRDIFLAKYAPSGTFLWAFHAGGPMSTAYEEGGQDLAVVGSNIYLTGNFEGTADFNPGTGTSNLISNGSLDIFVAKYDTDGNYQWAFNAGSNNKHDYAYGLDIDGSENVYITGGFEETVDFDPSPATSTLVSASVSAQDIFVAKYNSAGAFQWAFQAGGNSVVDDHAFDIDVTPGGDLYVTGEFWGPADFDPSGAVAQMNNSNDQIFIAKYNSAGNYVWAFEVGGTSSNGSADNGNGIHLAGSGVLYVTGDFSGTADFDPGAGVATLSVNNQGHAFVAAYNPVLVLGVNEDQLKVSPLTVFPNPAAKQIHLQQTKFSGNPWSATLTDVTGKITWNTQNIQTSAIHIDLAEYPAGVYFCTTTIDGAVIRQKLIVP